MKRSKPLSRSPLRPSVASPPRVNKARKARLFAEQFDSPEFAEFVKALPCGIPWCLDRPSEACHAVSRGAGGKASDVYPACAHHHEVQHWLGVRTFALRYGVSLKALAAETWGRWQARAGEQP